MSARLFPRGRERFANKEIDWDTDAIRLMMTAGAAATQIKAITGATVATPSVITATAHGGVNGDLVVVFGVGGTLSVNQIGFLAGVTTNTFTLKTLDGNLDVVGVGTYTSGGFMLNLTQGGVTLNLLSGARIADGSGTDIALTGKSQTLGVLNASPTPCTGVTGTPIGVVLYAFNTNDAGSFPIGWIDGKQKVRCAATVSTSATSIPCDPLPGAIANTTVLVFSNGISATLTSQANAGDVTLAVSAISGGIAANHQAEAPTLNNGFGVAFSSSNVTWTWDTVSANKIFAL